jgi:hypothetical protein
MLLTLIAILTGLSWQGGSVSARALPETAQVSAASALATVQQAKASAVLARPALADSRFMAVASTVSPTVRGPVAAPGTLVRIDRSRE